MRNYKSDDFELHIVNKITNSNKYDPFIIKDTEVKRYLFGQYQKMTNINKLPQIIKIVYELNKGNLIGRTTADYLTKNMNCYWPNIYFDWGEYVKQCIK